MALTMRLIGERDYSVFEDGQHIGLLRGQTSLSFNILLSPD